MHQRPHRKSGISCNTRWACNSTDAPVTGQVHWQCGGSTSAVKENPIKQHTGPAVVAGKASMACRRVTSDSGESRRKALAQTRPGFSPAAAPHQHTSSLCLGLQWSSALLGLDGWMQCRADELKSHMALSSAIFSNPVLLAITLTLWTLLCSDTEHRIRSDQIRSVAQSCPTLCNPIYRSTPGLPVHHQLPEFTQTRVHRVSDAIQPSHPLSSPSPLAPNPSQHQSLFQWVNSTE